MIVPVRLVPDETCEIRLIDIHFEEIRLGSELLIGFSNVG